MDEVKNNQKRFIDSCVSSMIKKFGKDSGIFVQSIEEASCGIKYFVSTGNIALDTIIGGGIPSGRLTEIFGSESTGKSIIGMQILANAQKMGGMAVYIDTEMTFDSEWAKKITGINPNELVYTTPDTVEDVEAIIETIIKTAESYKEDRLIAVVVDSIAATSFKREMEDKTMGSEMARRALLWSQALRKITKMISKNNIALVFINQVRDNIGVMYGPRYTTPGGNAIKFHSSVRIKLDTKGKIEDDLKNVIGVYVSAETVKNKIAPPFKRVTFSFTYRKGISKYDGVVNVLLSQGIITTSSGWYKYSKRNNGFRESEIENVIKEYPELLHHLKSSLIETSAIKGEEKK